MCVNIHFLSHIVLLFPTLPISKNNSSAGQVYLRLIQQGFSCSQKTKNPGKKSGCQPASKRRERICEEGCPISRMFRPLMGTLVFMSMAPEGRERHGVHIVAIQTWSKHEAALRPIYRNRPVKNPPSHPNLEGESHFPPRHPVEKENGNIVWGLKAGYRATPLHSWLAQLWCVQILLRMESLLDSAPALGSPIPAWPPPFPPFPHRASFPPCFSSFFSSTYLLHLVCCSAIVSKVG